MSSDATSTANPIWPVILWAVFSGLVENADFGSFVDFIQRQPNDLCSWDTEHEQWLCNRLNGDDLEAAGWFRFYSTQLAGRPLDLVTRKSLREKRTGSIGDEIQVKLWAFMWMTIMRNVKIPSPSVPHHLDSLFTSLQQTLNLPPLTGIPYSRLLAGDRSFNHVRSLLSSVRENHRKSWPFDILRLGSVLEKLFSRRLEGTCRIMLRVEALRYHWACLIGFIIHIRRMGNLFSSSRLFRKSTRRWKIPVPFRPLSITFIGR
ncbi:hypothetical protein C8J56DRAFT_67009 [Mycena floridula]|nr:hypothetical protein C8J56DRAFT_67009 [Mycena floridula]